MGRVETKRGQLVAKSKKPASDICYSRCALLQLSPNASPALAPSTSPDESPWETKGSLTCVSLDKLPGQKTQSSRVRAASEQQAKPSTPNTVMLKNIPFEYTRTKLCEELAGHGFGYAIDFLHLPIEAATARNPGHALLNLRTKDACRDFIKTFHGIPASACLPAFSSIEVCQVRTAEVQGRDANMKKLAMGSHREQWVKDESMQPLFLDDHGVRIPMQQWTKWLCNNDKVQRCTSAKNTPLLVPKPSPGMQASAPEFVPQADFVLDELAPSSSPALRPEAKEFVPSSPEFVLDLLPETAEIEEEAAKIED